LLRGKPRPLKGGCTKGFPKQLSSKKAFRTLSFNEDFCPPTGSIFFFGGEAPNPSADALFLRKTIELLRCHRMCPSLWTLTKRVKDAFEGPAVLTREPKPFCMRRGTSTIRMKPSRE
jgi:hypothetical protein